MEQERRSSGGQRIPFEALVVVASPKGGAGAYECEAVDLSENGMHLRTAYLPEKGQALTFRFDTGAGEVVLEGEVVWREEQARGGEFGVRFQKIDDATLQAIRETLGLGEPAEGEPAEAPKPERVGRGARVRLHIDGLGSPMRARVRDDHTGEVLVGSNLDFLRVGKPLELEDVERGKRRGAVVDKVEVEVDPASKVPQLVVTLRYEGAKEGEPARAAARSTADRASSQIASSSIDEATPVKKVDPETGAPAAEEASPAFKESIAQAGVKLAGLSAQARVAVGNLIERIRARRAEEQAESAEAAPRRQTAPPPDSGPSVQTLRKQKSSMEEPVENNEEISGIEETDEETLRIRKKQRTLIAAGAGLLAVLLVVFGLRAKSSPPPGADTVAAASSADAIAPANALPGTPGAPGAPGAPGVGGDVVSANVPLFGTTPLTTTEAAPLPAPSVNAAAPAPGAGGVVAVQADGEGDEGDDKGEPGKTEFGKGDVKKPRTVRLKMDAPITNVRGSTSDDSIAIFLPGRRNVEPAAVLSKRDKRLSAVKAVPKDGGVELTFSFKDEVPPFLAKANGKVLELDLGESPKDDDDGEGKSASAKKGGKKKIAKGSKAADKKKATAKKGDKKSKKKKKHSDD